MNTTIKLSSTNDKIKKVLFVIAIIAVFIICSSMLELNLGTFLSRLGDAGEVLPLFFTVKVDQMFPAFLSMITSICMAASALAVGFVISLVLSFLAANTITPNKFLAAFIKGAVAVIRAIPALVWILMVVASIGFGNTGGMIGLIFPTMGYLTKSFVASIEEMGMDTIEAMRATGASWFSIVTKGLLPGLLTQFISWIAIRFEGNIAESINLGMVGVAGIGSVLMDALGDYDYGAITALIIVIVVTLIVVEVAVNQIKRRIKKTS